MAKVEKITAVRGGIERKFNRKVWDNWPDGKYGWQPVLQSVPEVVAANMKRQRPAKIEQTGDPLSEAGA